MTFEYLSAPPSHPALRPPTKKWFWWEVYISQYMSITKSKIQLEIFQITFLSMTFPSQKSNYSSEFFWVLKEKIKILFSVERNFCFLMRNFFTNQDLVFQFKEQRKHCKRSVLRDILKSREVKNIFLIFKEIEKK